MTMKTGREEGEYDRLKAELRRLKRAGAPWYFESELHRRLHGIDHRRARLRPFPIAPAFGFSLITLGVIGIGAYLAFLTIQSSQPSSTDSTGMSTPGVLPSDSSMLRTVAPPTAAAPASRASRAQRVESQAHAPAMSDSVRSTVEPAPLVPQPGAADEAESARDTTGGSVDGGRAPRDSVRAVKDTSAPPPSPRR
ncbi:MAG: hypothetical protein AB1428_00180 [Bacteroidota bacterium]